MKPGFPDVLGVIPARLGSTRLPAKVLAPIRGRPMAFWVWRNACRVVREVVVATDHARVAEALKPLGVPVIMTRSDCPSGTDRVAAVARRRPYPFYLNVQGDEPLIAPDTLRSVCRLMHQRRQGVFTAASPADARDARSPHSVKVVCGHGGRALYFSRAPVPFSWTRGGDYLRHAGVYGYDRTTLLKITALKPVPLERRERLEQLRALDHGIPVWIARAGRGSRAVDTAADLAAVRRRFKGVR